MVRPGLNGELTPPNAAAAFAGTLVRVALNLPHYRTGTTTFREQSAPGKAAEADALRTAVYRAN